MPKPTATFKAYIDISMYDESRDQGALGKGGLQQFCYGTVTSNPIPKEPFLPSSKIKVRALIRHRKLWLSSDEGADELWDSSMMPWLESAAPELINVIDMTNERRERSGAPSLDFETIEIEIPPYTFSFPASMNQEDRLPIDCIDRFRILVNIAGGTLAAARPSIKLVEMPWEPTWLINKRFYAQQEPSPEENSESAIDDEVEDFGVTTETELETTSVAESDAGSDAVQPIASENEDSEISETSDNTSEEPQGDSVNPMLWRIKLIDGSMHIYDSGTDEWRPELDSCLLSYEVDGEATSAIESEIEQTRNANRPSLRYQDARIIPTSLSKATDPDELQSAFEAFAEKRDNLADILSNLRSVLIGVSGGQRSAVLALAAHETLGDKATFIFYENAQFFPPSREKTLAVLENAGLPIERRAHPGLVKREVLENTYLRCYHCRHALFEDLESIAKERSIDHIAHGAGEHSLHGKRAVREFDFCNPLKDAEITDAEIAIWAAILDLPEPSWSSECLASRFIAGVPIDPDTALSLGRLEQRIMDSYPISGLRIHPEDNGIARVEMPDDELHRILGERSDQRIDYHALTKLGNEWIKPASDTTEDNEKRYPYLGAMLKSLFGELRSMGYSTPLVEDSVEHNRRAQEYDPWWKDEGPRLNSWGRS